MDPWKRGDELPEIQDVAGFQERKKASENLPARALPHARFRNQPGAVRWDMVRVTSGRHASWCGMTEFTRKATQSDYEVVNGLVVFEVQNDQVEVYPRDIPLDLRTEETIG